MLLPLHCHIISPIILNQHCPLGFYPYHLHFIQWLSLSIRSLIQSFTTPISMDELWLASPLQTYLQHHHCQQSLLPTTSMNLGWQDSTGAGTMGPRICGRPSFEFCLGVAWSKWAWVWYLLQEDHWACQTRALHLENDTISRIRILWWWLWKLPQSVPPRDGVGNGHHLQGEILRSEDWWACHQFEGWISERVGWRDGRGRIRRW